MVHKKYTYKNGKRYGPYLYETKRVNGRIVTKYLGTASSPTPDSENHTLQKKFEHVVQQSDHKRKRYNSQKHLYVWFVGVLISLALILSLAFLPNLLLTGNAVLDIQADYVPGEPLDGTITLSLNEGELIPSDALVTIRIGEEVVTTTIGTMLLDYDQAEGSYYLEGSSLIGMGTGYGVAGTIVTTPDVSFTLAVSGESEESSGETNESVSSSSGGSSTPEELNESASADPTESEETPSDEPEGMVESDSEEVSGGESEGTISEDFSEEVSDADSSDSGDADSSESDSSGDESESSSDADSSDSGDSGSSESDSSSSGSESSSSDSDSSESDDSGGESESSSSDSGDSDSGSSDAGITGAAVSEDAYTIDLEVNAGNPLVYTLESGQTAQVVTDSVTYNGTTLPDSTIDLEQNGTEVIITTGYEEVAYGFGQAYLGNTTTFSVSLSSFGIIAPNESVMAISIEYDNRSLVSIEKDLALESDLSLETQANSTNQTEVNVTVNTTQYGAVLGKPVRWTKKIKVDENKSVNLKVALPESAVEVNISTRNRTTVPVISSEEVSVTINASDSVLTGAVIDESFLSRVTGFVVDEEGQEVDVTVDENVEEVEIEYYTEAPYAVEQDLPNGKEVLIVGPPDVHYENVLAFTELPESLAITQASSVRIYWVEEETFVDSTDVVDLNGNDIYDYVEWVAPHLSNQTFQIIVIIGAEHLDENRSFITDIYDDVSELDGMWSETIPEHHYVRVQFEVNLTSDRDITVYPRIVSGTPEIEVYEINGTEMVAYFASLEENEYNTVYLDDLVSESQDRFDLRIINGAVEFDHIIDPTQEYFEDCNDISDWTVTGGWAVSGGECQSSDTGVQNMTSQGIDLSSITNVNLTYDWDLIGTGTFRVYANSSQNATHVQLIEQSGADITGSDNIALEDYIVLSEGVTIRGYCVAAGGRGGGTCSWDNINLTSYADETPPSVTINAPGDGFGYQLTSIDFNVTLNENGAVIYSLDGGVTNYTMTGASTAFNATNASIAEGAYVFSAYANDTAGNTNYTENVSFSIDFTQPAISYVTPTTATGSQMGNSIYVNVSSSDTFSNHYAFTDFNNSLVLWYRYDDLFNATQVTDSSSYSHNGTVIGTVDFNIESGYYGNGSSNVAAGSGVNVTTPTSALGADKVTIATWVYFDNAAGTEYIAVYSAASAQPISYGLRITGEADFVYRLAATPATLRVVQSNSAMAAGRWYHLAGVFNGTNALLYVDGVLQTDQDSIAGALHSNTGLHTFTTNRRPFSAASTLEGNVDEVMIFNRALSAGEIGSLYNATVTQYEYNYTNLASNVNYTFTSYAVDRAGNVNQTETRSVLLAESFYVPYTSLYSPDNNTVFTSTGEIILNASVFDDDPNILNVTVFAGLGNEPDTSSIIYQDINVANSTNFVYNFTTPLINSTFFSDIIGLYHFDNNPWYNENSTLAYDFAGNRNGTISALIYNYSEAKIGGAIGSDGLTTGNVNYTDADEFIGVNKSYLFWAYPYDTTAIVIRDIINKYSGASEGLTVQQFQATLRVTIDDSATNVLNGAFTANEWHHYAITMEGDLDAKNNLLIYVDGELLLTNGSEQIVTGNDADFIFANAQSLGARFSGMLDEFVIVDRALSAEEVLNAYQAGDGTYYWHVNVSDGTHYNQSETRQFIINDLTVDTCLELNLAGQTYTQSANITAVASGACINITAPGVTFDGAGYTITNDTFGYPGIQSDKDNTTIQNTIVNVSYASGVGLVLEGANYSVVRNSSFLSNLEGVQVIGSHHGRFDNLTISANDDTGINFSIEDSSNNTLSYSEISNTNVNSVAVGSSNYFYYNLVTNTGFIAFSTITHNNILVNNTIRFTERNPYAVVGSNNVIANGSIVNSSHNAIALLAGANYTNITNVSIVNTSFEYNDINFAFSNNTRLEAMPYIANYSFSSSGGVITVADSDGEIAFTEPVNGSGINFSREIFVDDNLAHVSSTVNPGFNRSAQITLHNTPGNGYNVSILRDNEVCPSILCENLTSLDAASVVFTVASWTNYSLGDKTNPAIIFVNPTGNDSTTQLSHDIYVNISSSDDNGEHYALADFDNQTLLWLRMDDRNASGDPLDLSVHNHDAALVSTAVINKTGRFGDGLHADATGTYAYIDEVILNPSRSNFTVLAWIRIDRTVINNIRPIIAQDDGGGTGRVWLGLETDGDLYTDLREVTGSPLATSGTDYGDLEWHLVAFVWNGTGRMLWADGGEVASDSEGTLESAEGNLFIGANKGLTQFARGAIDEVFVFNRSLTENELDALYNAQTAQYERNFTSLDDGNYTFAGYAVDTFGNLNQTENRTIEIITNGAPTIPTPTLFTSSGTNQSNQDLFCNDVLLDPEANPINVSVIWFNNSVQHLAQDFNNSYSNGTVFSATLNAANTTRDENWTCSLRFADGFNYAGWVNSTNLTILNSPPVITLQYPSNDAVITNRTPYFNWTVIDGDGDTNLGYEFNISLVASSTCIDADRYIQAINMTNHTLNNNLACFSDNNDYYIWTVRSNDSYGFGEWATAYRLNVSAVIDISLPVDSVSFGTLSLLDNESTVDDSPPPLQLQNDGNANVTVNISATDLWESEPNPSAYYQYKFDNVSGEEGAFNWSGSVTIFTNMSSVNVTSLYDFTYIDTMDSVEIDLSITVPPNEPPGNKTSIITFISMLGEGYG